MKYGATPLLDIGKGSVMSTFIKQKDQFLFNFILKQLTPQHMKTGNTQPLVTACRHFDKDMVWALIHKQQDWLTPPRVKDLAIKHLLAYDANKQWGKEKWKVLQYLLAQGANPNFSTVKKRPALNYLIEGHPQIKQSRRRARCFRKYTRLLLKHQAQPLPQANDTKAALYLVVEKNLPTAVKMFLPQVPDSLAKQDTTLVAFAIEHRASYDIVKRLLDKGFAWNKQTILSTKLLPYKVRGQYYQERLSYDRLPILELLLKRGANAQQKVKGYWYNDPYKYSLLALTVYQVRYYSKKDDYRRKGGKAFAYVKLLLEYGAKSMELSPAGGHLTYNPIINAKEAGLTEIAEEMDYYIKKRKER